MYGLLWTLLASVLALNIYAHSQRVTVPESQLDSNRSFVDYEMGERIFVPKRLPKLTRDQKIVFLQSQGIDTSQMTAHKRSKSRKYRRSLSDKPWRIHYPEQTTISSKVSNGRLLAVDPHLCPGKFDAITEGHNQRTYIFSGEHVYQIWRKDDLQQKSAYKIADMFPGGPRTVTVAMTNLNSGVTILINRRRVYRFRWNRKEQRFYQTKRSPVDLTPQIDFQPTMAFQWKGGHMILSEGRKFVTYDPYWNVAPFSGSIADYFPNIPSNAIGLAHNGHSTFLLLTSKNELEIYDMKKFKVVQEYPLQIHNYVACMSKKI